MPLMRLIVLIAGSVNRKRKMPLGNIGTQTAFPYETLNYPKDL